MPKVLIDIDECRSYFLHTQDYYELLGLTKYYEGDFVEVSEDLVKEYQELMERVEDMQNKLRLLSPRNYK